MRRWLPPGHAAFAVMEAVGQLDLSGFRAGYRADGQGQVPYDPAVMLGLLFYCYLKGIRSTRKIAAACVDDVGCRVIAGGALPSHQAFAVFIRRHRAQLAGLFVQVLTLCAAEGLVQGGICAVDGSPVSANAALSANVDGEKLASQIAELEAALGAATEAFIAAAGQPASLPLGDGDDQDGGDDRRDDQDGGGLPRRLPAMAARLARLQAARQVLAAREAASDAGASLRAAQQSVARLEQQLAARIAAQQAGWDKRQAAVAAGTVTAGRPAVPPERSGRVAQVRNRLARGYARLAAAQDRAAAAPVKVSATDPGSRVLPGKNGGYLQGRNLQLAAVRRQVLLAIGLHDNPADVGALVTMIEQAISNGRIAGLEGQIRAWLADSGYASAANFAALDDLLLLVAVSAEAAQTGRAATATAVPAGWEKMAARLATSAGKKLYKRRAKTVEPAFAQFFARFGRYLSYRGDAAHDEVQFLGAVHNLAKLLDHRRRQLSTAT
jgi:transposase